MRLRRCVICREPFAPAGTGRRRRYCSDACRMKAYRRRRKRPVTPGGARLAAMFSCKTEEWPTPRELYDELHAEFDFTLDVEFLRGRLKFGGHENSAPFPSAIVVFRNARMASDAAPERYETGVVAA